jgi:hypothetical protein
VYSFSTQDTWWDVAKESDENNTVLSTAIAMELHDKQNNAFAQTTFSEKVQIEMTKKGYTKEAEWCEIIRNWYRAVDEAGLNTGGRIKSLLATRERLYFLSF